MKHLACWALSATLLACPLVVLADEAVDTFNKLYGDDLKRVVATPSPADDVALGKQMLEDAKKAGDQPAFLALLCEKAYELAAKDASGYATATAAMDLLAGKVPEKKVECLQKNAVLYQKQYAAARGEARAKAGEDVITALGALAEAQAAAGDVADAGMTLRQAVVVAAAIRSENKAALQARLDNLAPRQKVEKQIAALKAKLDADPKDAASRKDLVRLYLVEMDNPAEAAKFLDETLDEATRKYVPAAARPIEDAPQLACTELGDWYKGLADQAATPAGKGAMLRRAQAYYQRFLELHTAADLARTAATLTLKRIEDALAKLGPAAEPRLRARLPQGAILLFTFEKETLAERDGQVYLRDLSGKGNDGKVVGATFEEGRRGQAVAFNGAGSHVRLARPELLDLAGKSWTISFHLLPQAEGADFGAGIIDKDNGRTGFGVWLHGKRIRYWYEAAQDKDSEAALEMNKWHHVALTYDAVKGVVSFFVDGKPDKAYSVPSPHPSPGVPVHLGCLRGGEHYYKGLLDDVYIFDRVLSKEELARLE